MQNIHHGQVVTMGLNSKQLGRKFGGFSEFPHFPLPLFFVNRDMELIETNIEGSLAIEKHLLGLVGDKIHFNNNKNTAYVTELMKTMLGGNASTERFILPSIDMVYRAYTLSYEPTCIESEFLLYIQDYDAMGSFNRMEALVRAFSLTKSEANVLAQMVEGLKPKEIAYEANISLATVRSHLRTLYAKMNVRSYNDALKEAIRLLI